MPAEHFTKKADTPKLKHQWEVVYQGMLKAGKSSASAIKAANAAVKHNWERR